MYRVEARDVGRTVGAVVSGSSLRMGRWGSGSRPVACAKVGGGEDGIEWVWVDWNVGGKRDVEVVGNGNGGGASLFSGKSVKSSQCVCLSTTWEPLLQDW